MELALDKALQKGTEAHKAGNVQEAERYYAAILKAYPKHPDANHNMGVLAVGVCKVEAALPFFKTALDTNPQINQFWLSYIDALIKLNRLDDAKAVLNQARDKGVRGDGFDNLEKQLTSPKPQSTGEAQDPPQDRLQSLINLYKKGQNQECLTEASQLLNDFPKSVTLYNIIGAINQGLGNLDQAIDAFNKAISIKPDYVDAYNNIGVALKKQGKFDQSITAFNKAISIKPDYAEAYSNMGNTLKDEGKLEEAVKAYNTATSLKPNYADAYNNMGVALQEQGKLEKAIEAYKEALLIKPDYPEAYNNMGVALKDQGKLEEAIKAFKEALLIKPDYAEAYYNMGDALKDEGKLEEAVKAYNTATSLKPNYADAYNNMGVALQEQGKLEKAIEAYKEALLIKPDYAEAYNNSTELLKIYSNCGERSHILFTIDSKIKKLSSKLVHAKSNHDIINNLLEGFNYIGADNYKYRTSLSQIYKRNAVDLNCRRHKKIFDTHDIIPEFCFGCFKVQVDVTSFVDLVKVTSLFYKFNFDAKLTKKTIIELRPNIPGYYKGLIYCEGLNQAQAVRKSLNVGLKKIFGDKVTSKIKRGCSEYPLKFPEYGKIANKLEDIMSFPNEWKSTEQQFDQTDLMEPLKQVSSLSQYCLSDFYIIQKWIDYAKGIEDQSIEAFNFMPIIFNEIYELAKIRASS